MALDEGNNVVVRLRSRGPERRPSGRPDQCLRHGAPAGSGVWFWAFEEVHMLELVFDPSGIDFDRPGKHTYDVAFHMDGEWGYVSVPLTVVNGLRGKGKGVACFGGTHGDEYEGQVAARRLTHDLDPERVCGRVVIMPQLNPPACQNRMRDSPLDGVNMNRAFPGEAKGSITRRIADFVSRQVLPQVDVVIDNHAGGAPMDFAPMTSICALEDPARRTETRKVASLFDTPFIMVYSGEIGRGLLVEEAQRQGRIATGGEFGHGAGVSRVGVRHAYEGIRNVLKHYGMIPGEVAKIDTERSDPPRLIEALGIEDYVPTPVTGVFEPVAELGDRVEDGQLIGRLLDFERPDALPLEIRAPHAGYFVMHRFQAPVPKGRTLFVVAKEVADEGGRPA